MQPVPCPCGSGSLFNACHGVGLGSAVPAPALAPPSTGLRLDLGCGNTPRDGFEGVDIAGDKAKHKVDLFRFPWPWEDNSVEEIHASHFLEHIPAREVEDRDYNGCGVAFAGKEHNRFLGQDMLFAFMDEAWRVLKPGGFMHVIVPHLRSDRAFQDPTHRRFFCEATFFYFWAEWRKLNVPQYPVRCNFEALGINSTIPHEIGLRTPEVQGELIRTRWNVAIDLVAKLKAIK